MKPRVEVVAVDCLMVRLFDEIAEANMPWMLAASERLRAVFAERLIDLVPSYTTLMVHYDLLALNPVQARDLIDEALHNLSPDARSTGQCHVLPVWYDLSVGPELELLASRSGLTVAQVIRRHSEREYQVFALGFAPVSPSWGWWTKNWPPAPRHATQARGSGQRRYCRASDRGVSSGLTRWLEPDRAHPGQTVRS